MAGRRAEEYRAVEDGAKELDTHIDFRGISQATRTELHVFVAIAIRAKCRVVVNTADHVRPMSRRNLAVCGFLEIENVEGVTRTGNDVGSLLGVLREDLSRGRDVRSDRDVRS